MAEPFGGRSGKTKEVDPHESNGKFAIMRSLDIVTWDDRFQEPMPGKAGYSTATTANMFEVLDRGGVKNAFIKRLSSDELLVFNCDMFEVEAVIRFRIEDVSSAKKRNPDLPLGELETPIVEFFLKTKGKNFHGIDVQHDDPYIKRYDDTGVWVYNSKTPPTGDGVFVPAELLVDKILHPGWTLTQVFDRISEDLISGGLLLKRAWACVGWTLGDFKAEFGWNRDGKFMWADVVDNDSWRIKDESGTERSKQNIRDGKPVAEAASDFELVARMSDEVRRLALRA